VVLRAQALRWPTVDLRLGWRAERVETRDDGVTVEARRLATGARERVEADYAVGCDGPRSLVREGLGIRYEGLAGEERPWMGGRMLATYFRAPAFYAMVRADRSWQYWAINPERRAAACAIDGQGLFVLHVQLPQGEKGTLAYARESLALTAGAEFPHEILGIDEWLAGYTLVAERFGGGRVFLAGDAAHLFTPTAGQGYNTSVDDAANLGWKLAALCQGWGGPRLLESYERERRPIARRNTRFAREMADSIGRMRLPVALETDGPAGEAARAELGARLYRHAAAEFDVPGIHFGMWYGDSPIVAGEDVEPPVDDPFRYVPSSCPGARAPHVWLEDGVSIFDRFGRDFTLLRLGRGGTPDTRPLEAAARARGVPLRVLDVASPEARDVYARDLVLVRPDQHVAWRGDALPADPEPLVARVAGHA
jgi:2-polyprenyl-6-methoxyphenol hydroxylase-like FAD-dependent oxidoreductase